MMKALILLVILALGGVIALYVMSASPAIALNPSVTIVGDATPVSVTVTAPHGTRHVKAYIQQNGASSPLGEWTSPVHRILWLRHQPARTYKFEAGKNKAPKLKDGDAQIVVEAESDDLAANTAFSSWPVKVSLEPPRVAGDDVQHYINQGGMELAVLTPGGSYTESGVKAGKYTFRSFPLPGHPDRRFAMFAYPWDLPANVAPVVYARNLAGTEATAPFWFKLFPKKFRTRDFPIDEALMARLVNQIDPDGKLAPGPDTVSRFLKINGEMRRANNQQIADLRFKTEEKILWNGPFLHWGKEESMFADVRNYIFQGRQIDQQVHLGFDLSDTANAPVHVANDGRVVWAGALGIYGNCVVVDHGYALQSIYGHMNRIDVKVGEMVKKNQSLGVAGATGLAGGVHVHFSMQIDGVQVNPVEWWDEHWIHDRILSKLNPEASESKPEEKKATVVTSAPRKVHGKHRK
jgi:hypothetical protein